MFFGIAHGLVNGISWNGRDSGDFEASQNRHATNWDCQFPAGAARLICPDFYVSGIAELSG
jgi:hypothetical protein